MEVMPLPLAIHKYSVRISFGSTQCQRFLNLLMLDRSRSLEAAIVSMLLKDAANYVGSFKYRFLQNISRYFGKIITLVMKADSRILFVCCGICSVQRHTLNLVPAMCHKTSNSSFTFFKLLLKGATIGSIGGVYWTFYIIILLYFQLDELTPVTTFMFGVLHELLIKKMLQFFCRPYCTKVHFNHTKVKLKYC